MICFSLLLVVIGRVVVGSCWLGLFRELVAVLEIQGLTFQFCMGYAKSAMDTAVTRAELEHILRTMLQIVDNAYYRASPFTVEHDMLSTMKRMLEMGIGALQQLSDDECTVVGIIESVEEHAND